MNDLIDLRDGEALRAAGLGHLADDAPYQQCDKCHRKSWAEESFGSTCQMTQPSGHPCGGVFR